MRDDGELALLDTLLDDINLSEDLDELDLPQLFVFDEEWQFLQEQWGKPAGSRVTFGVVAGGAPPNTRNWTTTRTLMVCW
ncbi:MAG: hypothetical protein R2838_01170 [Caldilineaceae bacterium]